MQFLDVEEEYVCHVYYRLLFEKNVLLFYFIFQGEEIFFVINNIFHLDIAIPLNIKHYFICFRDFKYFFMS